MTTFDRHALLLGEEGRRILAEQTGVVVGLGGIGSVAAVELAHSGFGSLILVDHDILEESNRPRVIGSRPSDVENRVAKVEIARRYISESMPECNVRTYQTIVEDISIREELIAADFIVIGTDSARSRAYVNEICHRYYVPILDLGVEFVATDGRLQNEVGKTNLIMPGTPCLWCSGHVSSEMILTEELPEHEVRKRAQEGYVRNIHIPQPSMMPFNGEIASRGVQLLVLQLSGLAPVQETIYEQRSFLGMNNRKAIRPVVKHHSDDCPFCTPGSVLGAGDSSPSIMKAITV
ncbi:MAG: ThiF family adenylyltransferase [Candidatus Thiodiazotropha taylori]